MSYGDVTTQIIREDPQVEAYRLGLLADVQGFIQNQLQNQAALPPPVQVAQLSGLEQQAAQLGAQGIGQYQPYLSQAVQTMGAGQGAFGTGISSLDQAGNVLGQGQTFINQAAQQAAMQRAQPFQYQQQAAQALGAGTALGQQGALDAQNVLGALQREGSQFVGTGRQELAGLSPGLQAEMNVAQMGTLQAQAAGQAGLAGVGQDFAQSANLARQQAQLGQNALGGLAGQAQVQSFLSQNQMRQAAAQPQQAVAQAGQGLQGATQQGSLAAQQAAMRSLGSAQQGLNLAGQGRFQMDRALSGISPQIGATQANIAGFSQQGVGTAQQAAQQAAFSGQRGVNLAEQGRFQMDRALSGISPQIGATQANIAGFSQQGVGTAQQAAQQAALSGQRGVNLAEQGRFQMDRALSGISPQIGATQANIAGFSQQGVGTAQQAAQQAALSGQRGVNLAEQGRFQMDRALSGISPQIGATQADIAGFSQQGVGTAQQAAQQAALSGQVGVGLSEQGRMGMAQARQTIAPEVAQAQGMLGGAGQFGLGTAQQGISQLAGTGQQFTPSGIAAFYNPYEDVAVQQALSDIGRQGQLQAQNVSAQAVQSGAFGGSREAVAQQELNRNVLEQQARTAAQMRQAGFTQASQQAQQAFEQAQGRRQQAAQLTGQLGQAGAGTSLQAAQAAGQFGLSGAQTQADIAQREAQLGLGAQEAARQAALQGGQLNLSALQQAQQGALQSGQFGLTGAQTQADIAQRASQLLKKRLRVSGRGSITADSLTGRTAWSFCRTAGSTKCPNSGPTRLNLGSVRSIASTAVGSDGSCRHSTGRCLATTGDAIWVIWRTGGAKCFGTEGRHVSARCSVRFSGSRTVWANELKRKPTISQSCSATR
jgi:hypothetical protein